MLTLARGLADAALLSVLGALLAVAWLARGAWPRLAPIVWASLAACALLTLVWAALEAAWLAGTAEALPVVLMSTLFGHLILARLVLLALTVIAFALRRAWAATVLAALMVALLAGHGHAWAMYGGPNWLLVSEVLHLLAGGAWLGGLLPLLVLVRTTPPGEAALLSARFSRLATACVLILAGTALWQGDILIVSVAGLLGTSYGLVALLKLALFLVLLGFAFRNRFRLTPALAGAAGISANRSLARSIAQEACVGLVVVLAAGLLANLEPAMHLQPVWPFPWRPTLDTVSEDPSFVQEVGITSGVIAVAVLMALVAFIWRWRLRWLLAGIAVVIAFIEAPHLDLLFVETYPTSFWTSPTGFSTQSIADGEMLYPQNCAVCHGAQSHGDGPAAKQSPVPAADLTVQHLWIHSDGELFWWVSHGIPAPRGGLAMPGFAAALNENQRWALIDYIRAHNAGLAFAGSGSWPIPLRAPGLAIKCGAGEPQTLAGLSGHVVRVVFGPAISVPDAVTVVITSGQGARPEAGLCFADDTSARPAYAVVTGIAPAQLDGTQILIDPQGYLREVHPAGWDAIAASAQEIRTHKLTAASTSKMDMPM